MNHIEQLPERDVDALLRALGNCYMMAKREIARIQNGQSHTDAASLARWQQVKRFCEDAGCTSSILRAQVPTELTDGEQSHDV